MVGATGGIGEECVKLLKGSSANVYITGRNETKLREVMQNNDIPADRAFVMDLADSANVEQTANTIHNIITQLDIVINAAGIGIIKPLESLTYEDFDRTINTNLKGTFNLLKSFIPPMKAAKKGLFINIPGVLGKAPMAGAAAYAASKYGINGMVKSVREELRRTQVRITNVYLGGVDSPFWDDIDLRVQRDKFITAKEAARTIWFVCQQPTSGVVSEIVVQPFNHQAI